ncbi:C-type lectin protein [Ilyonectria robusta]|uniref:C-type lectin protein n=1 Tax=Ilyonectria robusta TaxID=1079257 RepID=UPI001E8E4A29|nr:C-type lectin protein [Ilyonectria robusta]KAH8683751.1 C-type lectin protein [Ilyonectria robusta]
MIPPDVLMEQPIPLRNPLLFYIGHIPTFEDIHLARATDSAPTEPAYYHTMFERGIDPDIDNPSICHDHSELPDVFPPLEEILMYCERVRMRIRSLHETGKACVNRCAGRALWIGFEHEALHVETFLFMTIQSPNIRPPPEIPKPDFDMLAEKAARHRVKNEWFRIPRQTLTIGFHDPETDTGPDRFFAWDNEREPYDTQVHRFETQGRPVSNGEYADYLITTKQSEIPATWSRTANSRHRGDDYGSFISGHSVKTVWGHIPLGQALDWPVMASFNLVQGYARWAGARLPSLHELRSIHEYAEQRGKGRPNSKVDKTPHTDPRALFVDLMGTSSGFRNFHPVSITHIKAVCGLGNTGGAAEWTSNLFQSQPGFKPMDIYPGYSADFMDGKHIAIVGGSWALHPRLAGQKSFLNWWQRGYAWPWVTFRLVRDIE